MDYEYGDELPFVAGSVSAFQWELTRDERAELEERLRRRRPCGFTARWPEQEEGNDEQTKPGTGRTVSGAERHAEADGSGGIRPRKKQDAAKPRSRSRKQS